MKELQAILRECEAASADSAPMALATVVKTEGSTYRRPGARMLMRADGRRIGSISGGCLDADVFERAKTVIATGRPAFARYDTRPEADVWFEQGCHGVTSILIERLIPFQVAPYLEFIAACFRARRTGVLATVFSVEGACNAHPGARLTLDAQGDVSTDIGDPILTEAALADARTAGGEGQTRTVRYRLPDGAAELLIEPILPPIALLLCGAGEDAIPLARMTHSLGWQVTIVDHRPALLTQERFPMAHALTVARPERLLEHVCPDTRTVAVLMTHDFCHDLSLLERLLPSAAAYIGLLGPRRRTERLLNELRRRQDFPLDAASLARLHSPAGLDIGAETPEEIALAITAEIQAALAHRSGGSLREHPGPIHAVVSASEVAASPTETSEASLCPTLAS